MTNPINTYTVPSVSITTARTGASAKANELGMRAMQERAWAKRGEQYLLIKSPPASGKSRALMFIALDKLHHQGLKQAIIVVPERSIGGSFAKLLLRMRVAVADGLPSAHGVAALAKGRAPSRCRFAIGGVARRPASCPGAVPSRPYGDSQ